MIGQSGNVCLSIYLFTGIPVTIYSTIELSDSVILLGITPKKFEEKSRWRCRLKSKFPRLSFLTKERKNKKEEKMIRLEPRLRNYQHSGGFRGGALGASAPPAESMVKIS